MNKPAVTFYGGVGRVTGANFLLTTANGVKILVDCGLFQGFNFAENANEEPFPYKPEEIDFLFVTHAHMDHIGRIPKLVHDGFKGKIFSTPETKALTPLMLADAYQILKREHREAPLYDKQDIDSALALWREIDYHVPTMINGEVSVLAKDAGHILGSAMYEFNLSGRKIVFTGDLGNSPSPLLRDTESVSGADYLLMESVYGDRNHEPQTERWQVFKEAILENAKRGGTLLIPTFSLERTQVLLSEIDEMVRSKEIPVTPVFVDSPLASRVTEVYRKMSENFNGATKAKIAGGDDPFDFQKLHFSAGRGDSEAIYSTPNPKIILAGSGMSHGGRVSSHERVLLPDPKNTLLIVGYQAPGTLGRVLADGKKEVVIDGQTVPVRAKMMSVYGYSSHKDMDHLISFVEDAASKLKKVFLVMGEPKASMFLAQRLRDYLGVDAIVPEYGQMVELE